MYVYSVTLLIFNFIDMIARLPSLRGSVSARRATLRALQSRRESLTAERRRSQLPRDSTNYLYDEPKTTVRILCSSLAVILR